MKKVYVIRTFNVLNPNENGFMLQPGDTPKDKPQVKLFNSKRKARQFLKAVEPSLRIGWIHIILPATAVTKGGMK